MLAQGGARVWQHLRFFLFLLFWSLMPAGDSAMDWLGGNTKNTTTTVLLLQLLLLLPLAPKANHIRSPSQDSETYLSS